MDQVSCCIGCITVSFLTGEKNMVLLLIQFKNLEHKTNILLKNGTKKLHELSQTSIKKPIK